MAGRRVLDADYVRKLPTLRRTLGQTVVVAGHATNAAARCQVGRPNCARFRRGVYPSHDFADAIAGAFGSALTYQAPVSRFLNSMSRDGVLPSRIFGQISPRFGTPVFAVLCVRRPPPALQLEH
ncbi:amino acid permease [Hoyosella sp. YIM 151337]|uniref:amino acid permease n=1 Tax=Hoyosella sp. YIM 151337 TaxID=2992742 RepID=UPI0027E13F0C|nr:amino acid permease [Hoyosella sp. YIM 151337]